MRTHRGHRPTARALAVAVALACALTVMLSAAGGASAQATSRAAAPAVAAAAGGTAAAAASAQRRTACRAGYLALTFDGGPRPKVTEPLVKSLLRLDVPATFLMVGHMVDANPEIAAMVADAGFTIGNHSYTHRDMRNMSAGQINREIDYTAAALRRAGVRPSRYFRFPLGSRTPRVERQVIAKGYTVTGWNVESNDIPSRTSAEIVDRVLKKLASVRRVSNILLLHDSKAKSTLTVKAVPTIVRQARRLGYCLSSLHDDGGSLDYARTGR